VNYTVVKILIFFPEKSRFKINILEILAGFAVLAIRVIRPFELRSLAFLPKNQFLTNAPSKKHITS
jgi:hypothetical protein